MVAAVAGRQRKRRSCARTARDNNVKRVCRVQSEITLATLELHATHEFLVRKRPRTVLDVEA
jgi:hypothetical protein